MRFLRRLFGFNKYVTPTSTDEVCIEGKYVDFDFNDTKTLKVGDETPDILLEFIDGTSLFLSELIEETPIILSFYRGLWCPNCLKELSAMSENQSEYNDYKIIAISPDCVSKIEKLKKNRNIDFDFVHDSKNKVAEQFGIVMKVAQNTIRMNKGVFKKLFEKVGKSAYKVPIPGTYIIGRDRRIEAVFLDEDYTKRVELSELVKLANTLPCK